MNPILSILRIVYVQKMRTRKNWEKRKSSVTTHTKSIFAQEGEWYSLQAYMNYSCRNEHNENISPFLDEFSNKQDKNCIKALTAAQ